MKLASIYWRENQFFIESSSHDDQESGLWASTPPVVTLPMSVSDKEIGESIREALSRSRIGVPITKERIAQQLLPDAAGVKTWCDFYVGAKSCSVVETPERISVEPKRNGMSFFAGIRGAETYLSTDVSDEELGRTIREAFKRCK